jgi:hypothetical protein
MAGLIPFMSDALLLLALEIRARSHGCVIAARDDLPGLSESPGYEGKDASSDALIEVDSDLSANHDGHFGRGRMACLPCEG